MQIIFIHIPKTAGGTFRNVLQKQYKRKHYFIVHDLYPALSINYLNRLTDFQFNQYKAIAGHCTHFLKKREINQKKIIFFRNPVKQIISGFYHAKSSVINKQHDKLIKIKSIKEYLDLLEKTNDFNKQISYLSIEPDLFFKGEKNNLPLDEQLKKSKAIVDSCDFVLLTEEFDESLIILKKELRWKEPFYIYKNVSKNRINEEMSEEIIEKLKFGQRYDFMLYEYAKQKYYRLRNNLSFDLSKEKHKFSEKNRVYNHLFGPINTFSSRFLYYSERLKIYQPGWKKPPRLK